jgi:hypothetical protein
MVNRGPQPESIEPPASPEETAAIVAALERLWRASSPRGAYAAKDPDGWLRAAILEGVSRHPQGDEPDPWINT